MLLEKSELFAIFHTCIPNVFYVMHIGDAMTIL